jgi:hypothetical protein
MWVKFAIQLAVHTALLSICNFDDVENRVYADLQAGTLATLQMSGVDSASAVLPTGLSLRSGEANPSPSLPQTLENCTLHPGAMPGLDSPLHMMQQGL